MAPRTRTPGRLLLASALATAGFALFGPGGCSSSGGGGEEEAPVTTRVSLPIGVFPSRVTVQANQPKQVVFAYTIGKWFGPYNEVTVDLAASLAATTVSPVTPRPAARAGAAEAPLAATVTARVGPAGTDADVCSTGTLYGPFQITGDSGLQTFGVSPGTATATPSTRALVNAGAFAVCVEVTAPVDLTFDVGNVTLELEECDTPAAELGGAWSGTYSCTNSGCANDPEQRIEFTVTQDGNVAHYSDGEASYDGTVCGNVFHFDGRGPDYAESGTLTLNPDGSATKLSSWAADNGMCSGNCTDQLTRQP